MFSLIHFVTAAIVVALVYFWKQRNDAKKYEWIPKVAGHPILGNVLDIRKPTDTIPVLLGYMNQHNGICSVDLLLHNLVIITDWRIAEFIFTSNKILDKSIEYKFLYKWLGNGLLTSTGERWRKSRKIITPAFHFSILKEFISVFETNTDILINILDAELDKDSVDIYPYIKLCTLDIIGETSMGTSLNAQRNVKSDYAHAVKEMCRILMDRTFSAIKHSNLLYTLTKDFYKERKCLKTLDSYTDFVIRSRKNELLKQSEEKGGDAKDCSEDLGAKKKMAFLDLLLQAKSDGKPLPDWYIREEVNTLMFEGHDTTSSSLCFALYSLAENPEVQVRKFRLIIKEDLNLTGQKFAVNEMKVVLSKILRSYELLPATPKHNLVLSAEAALKSDNGFRMKISRRKWC